MADRHEAATLRRRQADRDAAIARDRRASGSSSGPILVRVVDGGAKPSSAPAMIAVVRLRASCDREEGAVPTLTADDPDRAFPALCLGQIPPNGTDLIAEPHDGLLTVRYGCADD